MTEETIMRYILTWIFIAFIGALCTQICGNWKRDARAGFIFWILAPLLIPIIAIALYKRWKFWLQFSFYFLLNLNPDKK
jgi:hypothetical protein